MAGIPVRSGDADLTASGTPVRSAVQVQSSWRENDSVKKVAGPVRGCAGQLAETHLFATLLDPAVLWPRSKH